MPHVHPFMYEDPIMPVRDLTHEAAAHESLNVIEEG